MHEHGLPGANLRGAVEHLPGGHAVGYGRDRVGGVEAVRYRREVLRIERHALGPGPGLRQRRHPLAEQPTIDALAHALDLAHEVVAWDEGELGLAEVAAP